MSLVNLLHKPERSSNLKRYAAILFTDGVPSVSTVHDTDKAARDYIAMYVNYSNSRYSYSGGAVYELKATVKKPEPDVEWEEIRGSDRV